jgi:hypothetical protein
MVYIEVNIMHNSVKIEIFRRQYQCSSWSGKRYAEDGEEIHGVANRKCKMFSPFVLAALESNKFTWTLISIA